MENNAPRKKQLPAFLILGIIAVVAAVVLAVTNAVTKGPIAEHQMAALKDAFNAVMPADEYEEVTVPADYEVSSLYAAKQGGEIIGYCVTAVGKGYNGDVAVTLGVDLNGLVTGCSVGDTSFAETAGFGARAKEPAFQDQFKGIDAVNGGAFEALSGATVTSTAVLNATNAALKCVDEVALGKEPAVDPIVSFGKSEGGSTSETETEPLMGDVMEGTAKGFASDVVVQFTLDDAGAISALTVDASGETPGLGQRCMEEEFTGRFIGKTLPVEDVDVLTGATITSNAVIEAVNQAQSAGSAPAEGARTAVAKGYDDQEISVSVVLDDAGAVASLTVDASSQTPGLGQRCMEEEFTSQFIGKTGPFTLGDGIDAVASATITSTAVVEAVNEALTAPVSAAPAEEPAEVIAEDANAQLGVKADGSAVVEVSGSFTGTVDVTLNVEQGKVTGGEIASKKPSTAEMTEDGKFTATAKGFESNVRATLTLNEDGTIATLTLATANETEYMGTRVGQDEDFINQFIGKSAPFTLGEGIDAVSGVTVTSEAAIAAINDAAAFALENSDAVPAATEAPVEDASTAEMTEDGKFTATAKGFESNVRATLTLNEDGTIATLTLATANETEYMGTRVGQDEDFISQFIGKSAPFTLGEGIDAVASATYTSKAVVEAVNAAMSGDEELTAGAKGYDSTVTVTLTLDEDGAIAELTVDASGETPGLGQKCMEEDFINQFIGKSGPFTLDEGVDAVSGVTVTSEAAIAAINDAFALALENVGAN